VKIYWCVFVISKKAFLSSLSNPENPVRYVMEGIAETKNPSRACFFKSFWRRVTRE
jgi:hypothetical protein